MSAPLCANDCGAEVEHDGDYCAECEDAPVLVMGVDECDYLRGLGRVTGD